MRWGLYPASDNNSRSSYLLLHATPTTTRKVIKFERERQFMMNTSLTSFSSFSMSFPNHRFGVLWQMEFS